MRVLDFESRPDLGVYDGEFRIPKKIHQIYFGDDLSDRLRRNLALTLALQLAYDLGDHLLDALGLNRPLAQRNLHRPHELVAIERNAATVALYDGQFAQLHALEGRETEIAGQTNAAAADHGRIFGRPRVFHLRIEAAATRATHPVTERNPARGL